MTAVAEPTTRRINKTNISQALHHLTMSRQSLERAQNILHDFAENGGNAGDIATDSLKESRDAWAALDMTVNHLEKLDEMRRSFFGE